MPARFPGKTPSRGVGQLPRNLIRDRRTPVRQFGRTGVRRFQEKAFCAGSVLQKHCIAGSGASKELPFEWIAPTGLKDRFNPLYPGRCPRLGWIALSGLLVNFFLQKCRIAELSSFQGTRFGNLAANGSNP